MEQWPNFFIVGAPKAGTTSLYEYLKNFYKEDVKRLQEYLERKLAWDNFTK